jgi:hypothetical protein
MGWISLLKGKVFLFGVMKILMYLIRIVFRLQEQHENVLKL